MAKWWKLGLGGGKDKDQVPEETPAQEPTPAPVPAPEPTPAPAEGGEGKKRGLLGRLFGRGKKKDKAPKEAPAAPTTAPPSAPAGPGSGGEGPAPDEEAGGGGGTGGGAGVGGEGGEEAPPRTYPSFLHVTADGIWIISETEWEGTMSGTLHGQDVKTFIDAMEDKDGPDYETAIPLVADAYGIPGGLIDVERSTVYSVSY